MISVLLHLGYGFLRASVTLPFRTGKGRDRFMNAFAPEGLLPATESQRQRSASFERCIGCGLCELAFEEHTSSLSELSGSLWRAPETLSSLIDVLEGLDEAELERAESLCPTEVPLVGLVNELRQSLKTWAEWRDL